jgi:hypothetical protein
VIWTLQLIFDAAVSLYVIADIIEGWKRRNNQGS